MDIMQPVDDKKSDFIMFGDNASAISSAIKGLLKNNETIRNVNKFSGGELYEVSLSNNKHEIKGLLVLLSEQATRNMIEWLLEKYNPRQIIGISTIEQHLIKPTDQGRNFFGQEVEKHFTKGRLRLHGLSSEQTDWIVDDLSSRQFVMACCLYMAGDHDGDSARPGEIAARRATRLAFLFLRNQSTSEHLAFFYGKASDSLSEFHVPKYKNLDDNLERKFQEFLYDIEKKTISKEQWTHQFYQKSKHPLAPLEARSLYEKSVLSTISEEEKNEGGIYINLKILDKNSTFVLEPRICRVSLGPNSRIARQTINWLEANYQSEYIDIKISCPGAKVSPLRNRLSLNQSHINEHLEFKITPLTLGKIQAEVLCLIKNEIIHTIKFTLDVSEDSSEPVRGLVLPNP